MNLPEQILLNDPSVRYLISQNDYSAAAEFLFHSQIGSWELINKNYDLLKNIQSKSFWFDGFKIKVQFNPERIKSTSAEVDDKSVAERTCFLCIENLPEEQKGIMLLDKFLLLCNPYPIFHQHFTLSSIIHQPQRIEDNFNEMLEISKLLSPGYTLVYNGPACGASAPDHFHFQVGTKFFMPVEDDIQQMKNDYGDIIIEEAKVSLSLIDDGVRRILFIESNDQSEINNVFKKVIGIYKNLFSFSIEPMMNIICNYNDEFGWNVIIFLREKHRPECFYSEEPNKILVSPAAIDLGGILITPREEDFTKMNKELAGGIFDEVSLAKKSISILKARLKEVFN
jgi:hypothetical protein